MSLTAIVFWLVYTSGICTAVLYPVVGVALYVLVYHLNPESQWWGATIAQTGIRTSLTVAAATMLGIIIRRPRMENGARQFPLPFVLMLALVGYALLTVTWAESPVARSAHYAEKIVKLAVFVFILVRCVRQPAHYHLVLLAWLAGVAYISYQAWGHVGHIVDSRLATGLGGPDFYTSSGLSAHLIASLPLIGAFFFVARSWWARGAVLFLGALTVNTIVMTRTRNALVGLAAMSLVAVFWLPKGYRRKGLAAALVGILLAAQLTDPGWWRRMATIKNFRRSDSATARLDYWAAALDMARQHPLGIGLGQFRYRVSDYLNEEPRFHSAHSTYMACLAELGYPGAALLAVLVVAAMRRLSRTRCTARALPADLSADLWRWSPRFHLGWHTMALQCALIGYLACGVFTTRLWSEDFWILVGLSCCLGNVAADLQARTSPAAAPAGVAQSPPASVGEEPLHPPLPDGRW